MEQLEQKLKDIIIFRYGNLNNFCKKIDIPWTTLDAILKRGIKKANITNVIKICEELNIDCESLYYGIIVKREIRYNDSYDSLIFFGKASQEIGDKIKNRREELSLSRAQIADYLYPKETDSSQKEEFIQNIESGATTITYSTAIKLCSILDTTLDFLLGYTETNAGIELPNEYELQLNDSMQKYFKDKLKFYRSKANMKPEELARLLNVPEKTIAEYELLGTERINLNLLKYMAYVLQCTINDLLGIRETQLDPSETRLITAYRSLNSYAQKEVDKRVRELQELGYIEKRDSERMA